MKVLYFAWLRQRIGVAMEEIELPDDVDDVGDLVGWLTAKGPGYAKGFAEPQVIRAAVNFEYVPFDHKLSNTDEVAFFPPVTGG
ncbi:MAG: molybdopterin converting factor subunit 1 [Alphaproteobacteria bacterium]|nr:molybdopterin converting factor subunit 1 [Alphaproteobacteria bacterium]MCZ6591578.1 molybdopterin converting factor subunit 1 [Alphaproteobacteria bacterium]